MLKLVLAILAGIVIAFAIVFATDAAFHALVSSSTPPPDPSDSEAMRTYVALQPVGVLVTMVAGWAVAAFVGALVAARFGGRGEWPGWVVTGLFLAATVANFAMVTHPIWMVAAAVLLIVAAGWLGSRTGARTGAPVTA
jgi:hypothetical protein